MQWPEKFFRAILFYSQSTLKHSILKLTGRIIFFVSKKYLSVLYDGKSFTVFTHMAAGLADDIIKLERSFAWDGRYGGGRSLGKG